MWSNFQLYWTGMNGSGNTGFNSMMDRREALLLVKRLKRRTRDPDVLTLCEYVHGTDVHGTSPGFRRPGDGHRRLCFRLP